MSVIDTGNSVSGLGYQATETTNSSILGKDDFLRLLTTQLKYQDPLNPMDGAEFSAQLAQFSSVEQLQNISEALQQSIDANYVLTSSINNTMAANMIGKTVRANSSYVVMNPDQDVANLTFDLSADAHTLDVEILNEDGSVIRKLNFDDIKDIEEWTQG